MAQPKKGRFYDTNPTPQNLRALWDRTHDLDDRLSADRATILDQAATIAALQAQLETVNQQSLNAMITAGKSAGSLDSGTPGGDPPPPTDDIPTRGNYYSQVAAAKADLIAEGADLSDPACGAFAIVARAVTYIRPSDPTVGVLDKPGGFNCPTPSGGRAVDIVVFNNGAHYNVLIDSEGARIPEWGFIGFVDPDRWRES